MGQTWTIWNPSKGELERERRSRDAVAERANHTRESHRPDPPMPSRDRGRARPNRLTDVVEVVPRIQVPEGAGLDLARIDKRVEIAHLDPDNAARLVGRQQSLVDQPIQRPRL